MCWNNNKNTQILNILILQKIKTIIKKEILVKFIYKELIKHYQNNINKINKIKIKN